MVSDPFLYIGRLYKVLNAGVPIIVAQGVLLKRSIFLIVHYSWFFLIVLCEIKLIHQTVNFL